MPALLIALLSACTDGPVGGRAFAEDYAGREDSYLELAPEGQPTELPLILHIDGGRWVLRRGGDWVGAQDVADLPYSLDDGLVVGGDTLLPPRLAPGERAGGAEVTDRGEVATWYGSFEDAFTVAVEGGDWSGEQAFARDIGPVRISFQGASWELVYYE